MSEITIKIVDTDIPGMIGVEETGLNKDIDLVSGNSSPAERYAVALLFLLKAIPYMSEEELMLMMSLAQGVIEKNNETHQNNQMH